MFARNQAGKIQFIIIFIVLLIAVSFFSPTVGKVKDYLLQKYLPKPNISFDVLGASNSPDLVDSEFYSDEILVKMKAPTRGKIKENSQDAGVDSLNQKNKKHNAKGFKKVSPDSKKSLQNKDISGWYRVSLNKQKKKLHAKINKKTDAVTVPDSETADYFQTIADYQSDPNVEAVEPSFVVTSFDTPSLTVPEAAQVAKGDASNGQKGLGMKMPTQDQSFSSGSVSSMQSTSFVTSTQGFGTVDLSQYAPPVGNQGYVGSCTAWAIDYGLRGYQANKNGQNVSTSFAPMYTYAQIVHGYDYGSWPYDNFDIMTSQGVDTRVHYTQGDFDYSSQPNTSEKTNAAQYKITSWAEKYWPNYNPGGAAVDLIRSQMDAGNPVALGIPVYPQFDYATQTNDYVDTVSGGSRGLHEVAAYSYDNNGVWIENSWGTGWGYNGWVELSWNFIQKYVFDISYIDGTGSNLQNGYIAETGGTPLKICSVADITSTDQDTCTIKGTCQSIVGTPVYGNKIGTCQGNSGPTTVYDSLSPPQASGSPTPSPTPGMGGVPNDPYYQTSGSWGQAYDDMWGMKKINAVGAWKGVIGGDVVVADIDTGMDWNNPDLKDNLWTNSKEIPGNGIDDDGNGYVDDVNGWNYVNKSGNPMDDNGHGTHTAGTIAASGNNGTGVTGVIWKAKIMPVKFLDNTGTGSLADAAQAIRYAADNGAKVLSNSWGCKCAKSQLLEDAIKYAHDDKGATLIFAAGNNNGDALNFSPANNERVITVGASDQNDNKASFSNWGDKLDVLAPGVDILSTKGSFCAGGQVVGTNYCRLSGTSMATPHVAGLAALLLAKNSTLKPEDIRQLIRQGADDVSVSGKDPESGYGRIDVTKTIALASNPLPVSVFIASPQGSKTSQLDITGTAAGPQFSKYKLEAGQGRYPSSWFTLKDSATPVTDGSLGQIDPLQMTEGNTYTIRLTVTDITGKQYQFQVYDVLVDFLDSQIVTPQISNGQSQLNITGTALAKNGISLANYKLEWGAGVTPVAWSTDGITLSGNGSNAVTNGILGSLDLSRVSGGPTISMRLTVNGSDNTTQQSQTQMQLPNTTPAPSSVPQPTSAASSAPTSIPTVQPTPTPTPLISPTPSPTPDPANDHTPPTLTWYNPNLNGSRVSGIMMQNYILQDDIGVASEEFDVDGALYEKTNMPQPYTKLVYGRTYWDTTKYTNGSTHTITQKGTDENGNVVSSTFSVVVDQAAPTPTPIPPAPFVTLTYPTGGETLVAGDTVKITWNTNSTNNCSIYWGEPGSIGTQAYGVGNIDNASVGSINWKVTAPSLEPGKIYQEQVEIVCVGVPLSRSNTFTVKVTSGLSDVTAPTASVTAPTAGAKLGGLTTFQANASDDVAVSSVQYFVDGNSVGTVTNPPYNLQYDTSNLNTSISHAVQAVARDNAGNIGRSNPVSFYTTDQTPPVVSINSPSNNATVKGIIYGTITANDTSGIDHVELWADNAPVASSSAYPYSYKWDTTKYTQGSQHTLVAKAFDKYTNVGSSTPVSVTIADNTAPNGSVTSPTSGTIVRNSVEIKASASDNVGVTMVDFLIDGVVVGRDSTTPYTYLWNSQANSDSLSIQVYHNVAVAVYDKAGNRTVSQPVPISIVSPPQVTISSPTNNSSVTGTVTIKAGALSLQDIATVKFFIDDKEVSSATTAPYTFQWDTSTLPEGSTHTIVVKATNALGNTGQSKTTSVIIKDTHAPSIKIVSPVNGSNLKGNFALQADATDTIGIDHVEFLLDGKIIRSVSKSPFTTSWNTLGLDPKVTHTITAQAFDTSGNKAVSNIVTVHTAPPSPPSIQINKPQNGIGVDEIMPIDVSAKAPNGLKEVNVLINGVKQKSFTNSQFDYLWNTRGLPNGTYAITTELTDLLGDMSNDTSLISIENDTDQIPAAPVNLFADTRNTSKIVLQWQKGLDNQLADQYALIRNGETVALVKDTTFTDTNIITGQKYLYQVVAMDKQENYSAPSNAITIIAAGLTTHQKVTPPQSLTADAVSPYQVNLSWKKVDGATGYEIYRNGTMIAQLVDTTTFGDFGLIPNTDYTYQVKSLFGGQSSDLTSPSNVKTLPVNQAGRIEGLVQDAKGNAVKNAKVFVYFDGKKSIYTTNSQGQFSIMYTDPGIYDLNAKTDFLSGRNVINVSGGVVKAVIIAKGKQ